MLIIIFQWKNDIFSEFFINHVFTAVNENVARSFDVWVVVRFPSIDITKSYKTLNTTLCKADYSRFDVLTTVVMKSSIFWDIMSCSPLKVNRRFGGTCRLHFQGLRIIQARNQAMFSTCFHVCFLLDFFFEPEMEATDSSEKSADFKRTTQSYISENRTLQII
jgi:hypothetical protein